MNIKPPDAIPENVDPSLRVNCARFVESLKGTVDGVYGVLITIRHGAQTKSVADWQCTLDAIRNEPVETPDALVVRR